MAEEQNAALKGDLVTANKLIADLQAQLRHSEVLRQETEGRLSSTLLEQGVWSSTRGGVQQQLAEAFEGTDSARRAQFAAERRAEAAEAQQDQLMQRILELECLASAANGETPQRHLETDSQRLELEQLRTELRESNIRISDLASQLRVQECEAQIALGRAREAARQSVAQAVLHRAEAAECRMAADVYR